MSEFGRPYKPSSVNITKTTFVKVISELLLPIHLGVCTTITTLVNIKLHTTTDICNTDGGLPEEHVPIVDVGRME